MERLRIGLLSYEYPPETGLGGIGTYTWTQAQALARAGHEVHVLAGSAAPGPKASAARRERDGDVTVWRDAAPASARRLGAVLGRLGWWWSRNRLENGLRMRRLLGRVAAREKLDLVEVPECGGEGLFLPRRWETRKVVRFHSPAELIMPFYDTRPGDRRLCAWLERRGYRRAAAATSCSAFLAREVAHRLGYRQPIVTVPNGIDLTQADGASTFDLRAAIGATGATGAGAAEPVVLFAGRFEPRKGSALLGELVPELLARRSLHFVVLGEDLFGHGERELVPRCRARQGEPQTGALHLLGRRPVEDVRAAMRQADVVLLPSRWENAPYTVLEAMAAGAPLVVSRVGGIPELVADGSEALVVADQDVAAHLTAVRLLLDNRELAQSLGAAARRRVEREFTADGMAERSLGVYRRVVEGAG
ncbi:MAG: glycosyltransferase family 4 protein [Thermoanaerobaculia bacterium]|nr:glycosyltransferase family 4 protein [Thermoanaerobaculia bacterium]MBP9823687.1 glycosyltransferase family 4 protein [Thermoanaerobaculia bacterium]